MQQRHVDQLEEQLAAIQRMQVIVIDPETDPAQRQQWAEALDRAIDAVRADHEALAEEERQRPHLRVFRGGAAVLAGLLAAGGWMRGHVHRHPVAAVAGAATAAAGTATLLVAVSLGESAPAPAYRPEQGDPHTPATVTETTTATVTATVTKTTMGTGTAPPLIPAPTAPTAPPSDTSAEPGPTTAPEPGSVTPDRDHGRPGPGRDDAPPADRDNEDEHGDGEDQDDGEDRGPGQWRPQGGICLHIAGPVLTADGCVLAS